MMRPTDVLVRLGDINLETFNSFSVGPRQLTSLCIWNERVALQCLCLQECHGQSHGQSGSENCDRLQHCRIAHCGDVSALSFINLSIHSYKHGFHVTRAVLVHTSAESFDY